MRMLVCAAACLLLIPSPSAAQVVRLSVTTAGVPGADSHSYPSVSADGRFVAFDSTSGNLAPGDNDPNSDVFLRDRDTDGDGVFDEPGAVSTICVSTDSLVAAAWNYNAALSRDGRYVFFMSLATGSPTAIIYRFDRQGGTLLRVGQGPWASIGPEQVSANGDVMVVGQEVTEIAAGQTTVLPPPYVVQHPLPDAHLVYSGPSLSADGNRIAYAVSIATANSFENTEIYVYDRPAATWTHVPGGTPTQLFLAASGTSVLRTTTTSEITRSAVGSGASRTVPGELSLFGASPDLRQVVTAAGVLRDLDFGTTTPLGLSFSEPVFSADGRWLVVSAVNDLPANVDNDRRRHIYAIDLAALLDADHDGMDDRWESIFGVTDPAADPDGDGQTNAQEEDAGTHPNGHVRRYLAEGATGSFFHTTVSLANPGASRATAVLTFDRGDGTRIRRPIVVPALRSASVDVGAVTGLEYGDVATTVESDAFLAVERSMTWGPPEAPYGSHSETATPSPSATWFLAEGSTVLGFDLFYLLQNPQATTTHATVRFLLPDGAIINRTYDLAPGSRTTIYVNQVPGLDETDVSGEISADAPIVVERAMYRGAPGQPFALGTESMGVPAAATAWFLAEGATGAFFDLYVLIANPGSADARVAATFLRPDGSTVQRIYTVRAHSRFSVYVDAISGLEATAVATTLTSDQPIVAERAMYWPNGFFEYYEGHSSAGSTATALRWVVAGAESGGTSQAQTYVLIANTENRTGSASITLLPDVDSTAPPPPPFTPNISLAPNSRTTVPFALSGRYGVLVESTGANPVQVVVESAVYRTPPGGSLWAAGSNALATPVP